MFTTKNLLKLIGRNIIISLMAIILAIITIFFLQKEIVKLTDNINAKQKEKSEQQRSTDLYSIIENDAKIIGGNYKIIENAFVSSNDISEFTTALDKIGSKYKVLQNYYFESPVQSTILEPFPVSTIPYTNNFAINIASLIDYLHDFEKLPYFTQIESITISSQDKSGWVGLSTVLIKAKLNTKTTN